MNNADRSEANACERVSCGENRHYLCLFSGQCARRIALTVPKQDVTELGECTWHRCGDYIVARRNICYHELAAVICLDWFHVADGAEPLPPRHIMEPIYSDGGASRVIR